MNRTPLDKGAARSRKRAQQLEKAAAVAAAQTTQPTGSKHGKASQGEAGPSRPRGPSGPNGRRVPAEKKVKEAPEPQSRDPSLYKAKAIRSATALVWPCTIPPPSLEGITRVDLTNSGVKNVEWLRGSGVRWLGLSGCKVDDWDVIGTLQELTVLNVNECGLNALPKAFGKLHKLKAFVAMNNPWQRLDPDVISQWTELNSMIISHSPNLLSIPSLTSLVHLSKLTFSHCPRITPASLPDLSSLPVLKDLKMNNLPLLTALPPHLLQWGTGSMSRLEPTDTRSGLGLEALDAGNCSLHAAVIDLFKTARLPHIRSITLHHNPLELTVPDYPAKLQALGTMPRLQIVDNKRVVERKQHDAEAAKKAKKAKRKDKAKVKMTGFNAKETGNKRDWGVEMQTGDEGQQGGQGEEDGGSDSAAKEKMGYKDVLKDGGKDKKRKRGIEADEGQKRSSKVSEETKGKRRKNDQDDKGKSTDRTKSSSGGGLLAPSTGSPIAPAKPTTTAPASTAKMADPSTLTSAHAKRHSKNETGVFGVVEVASANLAGSRGPKKDRGKREKRKGDKFMEEPLQSASDGAKGSTGGVDLKSVFAKSNDTGLGVGGW